MIYVLFKRFAIKPLQISKVPWHSCLAVIAQRYSSSYEERRVVVTGLGAVTPLGVHISTSWQRLINAECAIRKIEEDIDQDEKQYLPIYSKLPSKIAARIPLNEFTNLKTKYFSTADSRVMSKGDVWLFSETLVWKYNLAMFESWRFTEFQKEPNSTL